MGVRASAKIGGGFVSRMILSAACRSCCRTAFPRQNCFRKWHPNVLEKWQLSGAGLPFFKIVMAVRTCTVPVVTLSSRWSIDTCMLHTCMVCRQPAHGSPATRNSRRTRCKSLSGHVAFLLLGEDTKKILLAYMVRLARSKSSFRNCSCGERERIVSSCRSCPFIT